MKIKLIEPGILGTPMHLLRLIKLSELEQFFADNLTATDAGTLDWFTFEMESRGWRWTYCPHLGR